MFIRTIVLWALAASVGIILAQLDKKKRREKISTDAMQSERGREIMMNECAVCGKKIGCLTGRLTFRDGVVCTKCYERAGFNSWNGMEMNLMTQKTVEEWKNMGKTEYRKKCKVCGKIFCYTEKDLSDNREKAGQAMLSAIGGVSSAVGGSAYGTFEHGKAADRALDRMKDYNKCPQCGSIDLVLLSKEEYETEQLNQENEKRAMVSAADELKKFKELLDMGVITQEEFDVKKKQLLGL